MAYVEWSHDLDTGVDVIDNQHRRIVDYINELYEAQESGDRAAVGEVLDQVVEYTVSHFSFEESLMQKAGYEFLDSHRKVHELFIKRAGKYVERFNNDEDIAGELLSMLRRWLINHIKNEDSDYVPAVKVSMRHGREEHTGWLSRTLKRFFR